LSHGQVASQRRAANGRPKTLKARSSLPAKNGWSCLAAKYQNYRHTGLDPVSSLVIVARADGGKAVLT